MSRNCSRKSGSSFLAEIETDKIAKGLSEEVVRLISAKKDEPDFLLQFRLKAFRYWLTLEEPDWAALGYPEIDYQNIVYYAAPKQKEKKASLDEVDPKLLETFDKLGIPLSEQKRLSNVAVDAVFDSVSVVMVCVFSGHANGLSSVRKSMQWHSLRSRIGTQGQFQKACETSASLSS